MKNTKIKIIATCIIFIILVQYSVISLAATKSQLKSQQSTLNSKIKETQELNRKTIDGKGTYDIVEEHAKNLLDAFDWILATSVITRNNLYSLSKNVEHLINMGFKYINLLFDYSQDWQDRYIRVQACPYA